MSSNAAQTAWQLGLQVLCIPILYRLMGAETFAWIAIFFSAQAVLAVLDMGLSPTIIRLTARRQAQEVDLLRAIFTANRSVGLLLLSIAGIMACGFVVTGHFSALAATCIFAYAGLRWPSLFWMSSLRGQERHGVCAIIAGSMSTIRIGGAIALAVWFPAGWENILAWMVLCALVETLIIRVAALHSAPHPVPEGVLDLRNALGILRQQGAFTLNVAGAALSAAVLKNTDRLLLAPLFLGLEGAGIYGALAGLTTGVAQLSAPIVTSLLPRLSRLWQQGDASRIRAEVLGTSQLCGLGISLPTVAAMGVAPEIIGLWLGHPADAIATLTLQLLLLATALNAVMQPLYALQLSAGRADMAMHFNATACIWVIPLQAIAAWQMGMSGLAIGWLAFNGAYVSLQLLRVSREVLPSMASRWSLSALVLPVAMGSLIAALLIHLALTGGIWIPVVVTAVISGSTAVAILLLGHAVVPELRALIFPRTADKP